MVVSQDKCKWHPTPINPVLSPPSPLSFLFLFYFFFLFIFTNIYFSRVKKSLLFYVMVVLKDYIDKERGKRKREEKKERRKENKSHDGYDCGRVGLMTQQIGHWSSTNELR